MTAYKLSALVLSSALFFSCGSDEPPNTVRELNVSDESVTVTERSSYFSLNRYGVTQKIFHFQNENSVLKISVNNESTEFETAVEIIIFDLALADGAIEKWVNNQVSDGLYGDAPEPQHTFKLHKQSYQITDHSPIGDATGEFGDEYEGYLVQVYIDNVFEENSFYLASFSTDAEVYVQTKDIDPQIGPQ